MQTFLFLKIAKNSLLAFFISLGYNKVMRRILLKIEYVGTNYAGWQKQPNQRTIQGEIENAIFRAIGEQVEVFGSGRTDAGVHALGQTAHFDLSAPVPISKLAEILNNVLPSDICILSASEVESDFHARFSIKKKCYLYKIYNSPNKNAFLDSRVGWVKKHLDEIKMQECGNLLIGKHDFRGFCSAQTCAVNFEREIFDIRVKRDGDFVYVEVEGSGFLYNMVRIIVGTMVDFALDKLTEKDVLTALKTGERSHAGQTMPACGLYLKQTWY